MSRRGEESRALSYETLRFTQSDRPGSQNLDTIFML